MRIARTPEQSERLAGRMKLLNRLASGFPFALPVPLAEVQWHEGRAAVVQRYIPGAVHAPEAADVRQLRAVVDALQAVDTGGIGHLLEEPFAYAGSWTSHKQHELFGHTPADVHRQLRPRLDALLAMEPAEPSLVHGDLAGSNIHWLNGRIAGILDWDLASCWDPAINVAYLSMWHGADMGAKITDSRTAARAAIWRESLILESLSRAIADNRTEMVGRFVGKLRRQA